MTTLAPPQPPGLDARVHRLRDPLLGELSPEPHRRRGAARARPLRALAVATLSVALALGAIALTRGPAPALAVERADGWIELRVADASAGAATLTHELRAAGIRGEVRLVPAPADQVGRWAIIAEHADAPGEHGSGSEETVRLNRVENDGVTLRIPVANVRESSGYFVFYAGREARPGEELMRDGQRDYAP